MRNRNVIGPEIRRLRSRREMSQNDLAIKLQILGMEEATRGKVSKIEARRVCVSDDDLIYISRALGVGLEELYPDFIRGAKRLYDAICMAKTSRFGLYIFGLLSCSQTGAGVREFVFSIATV
jgi:transcriptional regulator with XRE-family HTH domain